jgi:hypothetical protein
MTGFGERQVPDCLPQMKSLATVDEETDGEP